MAREWATYWLCQALDKDRYIQVSYAERDSQTNWRSVEETVLLDDGKRYWFRCPTCNRRAGTLFMVGPPFGCRVCMRLANQSQRQSPEERIRTRALRLRHLLNGSGDAFDYGLSDEDLDNDFDEDLEDDELEDDDLEEELEDDDLDEELGEGDFD